MRRWCALGSLALCSLVVTTRASAFEPPPPERESYSPPRRSTNCGFHDFRLTGAGAFASTYSAKLTPSGAAATSSDGGLRNGFSFRLDYVGAPTAHCQWGGLVYALGGDIGNRETNLIRNGAAITSFAVTGQLGYVLIIHYNFEIEIAPFIFVGFAAFGDHGSTFSNDVPYGWLYGGGGKAALLYTFDSGWQIGTIAAYAIWSFSVSRDGAYTADITGQEWSVGLVVGRRLTR